MIVLRRLGGQIIALNPDLIERIETTPDTVVTLVDEKKFLVEQPIEEILELITDYRAYVLARSRDLSITRIGPEQRPELHVVPNDLVASDQDAKNPETFALFESKNDPDNDRPPSGSRANQSSRNTTGRFG